MSNLSRLEFVALDISGNNYLSWILDAEIHLNAMGLGETIKEENNESLQNCAKAMIFLRHHLHEDLKSEYLTVKDPLELWNNLKDRYDHQRTVILPKTRYEWIHLRFQDFRSVSEYNSAVFRITSQLKLCGENITDGDMLEKTYSTFHASNLLLQQQYRERGFKKYSELISCLLVAEQNNDLLMKNHETRPVGASPLPEANVTKWKDDKSGNNRGRFRGCGRGRGRFNNNRGGYRPYNPKNVHPKWTDNNNQQNHVDKNKNENSGSNKNAKGYESLCYRCGIKGHWSRTCRTPKHLVELYQASQKGKGKEIETNVVYQNDYDQSPYMTTHLDVADFLVDSDGGIDHLISDGNVSLDTLNI